MFRIGDVKGRQPLIDIGLLAYLVGWSWPLILVMCGVGLDGYRIALVHKLSLTAISILLPVLIKRFGGRYRRGCAMVLGWYCALVIVVIWYWN